MIFILVYFQPPPLPSSPLSISIDSILPPKSSQRHHSSAAALFFSNKDKCRLPPLLFSFGLHSLFPQNFSAFLHHSRLFEAAHFEHLKYFYVFPLCFFFFLFGCRGCCRLSPVRLSPIILKILGKMAYFLT